LEKTNIHYWLALKLVPRLAIHRKLALIEAFGLKALFFCSKKQQNILHSEYKLTQKQLTAINHPDWSFIDEIILASTECQSEIITYNDFSYPEQLKQIYDPPLILFVQGNKKLLQSSQIAIVGSRFASISGCETAFEFAKKLSDNGIAITSGLALGIDAAAHKGALVNNIGTIAVVATGLDKTYPARHKYLVKKILNSNGAIISEYIPGTSPKPGHFPKRNRLISGLSLGVLVVEAAIKSGSLITARSALEQNRDVFAIPGSIYNPLSKGSHWLIQQGAKLVEEPADIINELVFVTKVENQKPCCKQNQIKNIKQELDKNDQAEGLCNDTLLVNVGFEITPVDKIVFRSKLPVAEVLTRLTTLELKGLVSAVPGGYLRLK